MRSAGAGYEGWRSRAVGFVLAPAAALALVGFGGAALAADRALVLTAPPPVFDWNGFYFGGHVSYLRGSADITIDDPTRDRFRHGFGSLIGGVHGGYNYLLSSRLLVGIEGDVTFPNYLVPDEFVWTGPSPRSNFEDHFNYVATVRGRLGYVSGNWMAYGTAGFAFSNGFIIRTAPGSDVDDTRSRLRTGWAAGAGIEYGFEPAWSARLEYLYAQLGSAAAAFGPDTRYASSYDAHMLRLGLSYKLGQVGKALGETNTATVGPGGIPAWEFHAQTTFVYQGYPAFRSPYSGANSLFPGGQARETFSNSAYLGVRLWDGGELHYNPELLQGFGVTNTVGAGGYPNGEAQKSDFLYPHYHTARLFVRHTFSFGGGEEKVESEPYQLGGKRDVSRLTVQAGRFSVKDQFDQNEYASDPRVHFLNWSMWAAGAFDYAADRLGVSYGATAEYNQKGWAVRAGYFLVGNEPNSNNFDRRVFERGGYVAEGELRYSLFSQPGKLRVLGWINNAYSGSYRDALGLVAATPGLDPNDAMLMTRQGRMKYGYAFNAEQQLTSDIGAFARWSWNNGKTEIMAFTDIDASLAGGLSVKGRAWGRPNDTVGIGGAINALSREHRDFVAAGGLGILIGDGRLNYRDEQVFEAFYAIGLRKDVTLTLDYQHLRNPAYNADRGPVHFFAARMHAEL